VSGNLPCNFGFVIEVHAHEPDTLYVVPIKSDSEHYPPDGRLRVYRSHTGGDEWEPLTSGLPQRDCYINVLREAMAVDPLDPYGVYFGRALRGGAGSVIIRVILPPPLCTLARIEREVALEVVNPITQQSLLDALEARYPVLRGTLRDQATQ
jgi:hypothetical protein